MSEEQKRAPVKVEKALRRLLTGMGSALDRNLRRTKSVAVGFTTDMLIERMKYRINELVIKQSKESSVAPHHLCLKIEWGTLSDAPLDTIEAVVELENDLLVAAVEHINNNRWQTLAPVKIETVADIFTTGISVEPTFGEFAESFNTRNSKLQPIDEIDRQVTVVARIKTTEGVSKGIRGISDKVLTFIPGGKRINVGRIADNTLQLNHESVSKVHAALVMNREGTLLVADTGSTNGTFINGRRISYGEARQIEEGDVVAFGEVEIRFSS
ncbi:MAG: FHA domain-containing protein [Pyrinomonadaceae bacterium]